MLVKCSIHWRFASYRRGLGLSTVENDFVLCQVAGFDSLNFYCQIEFLVCFLLLVKRVLLGTANVSNDARVGSRLRAWLRRSLHLPPPFPPFSILHFVHWYPWIVDISKLGNVTDFSRPLTDKWTGTRHIKFITVKYEVLVGRINNDYFKGV